MRSQAQRINIQTIIFFAWIIPSIFYIVIIILTIQSFSKGTDLLVLEDQVTYLKDENSDLRVLIAKESSLMRIGEKARSNGFDYASTILYIK